MVMGWQAVIGTATNLRSADGSIFARSPHKICTVSVTCVAGVGSSPRDDARLSASFATRMAAGLHTFCRT